MDTECELEKFTFICIVHHVLKVYLVNWNLNKLIQFNHLHKIRPLVLSEFIFHSDLFAKKGQTLKKDNFVSTYA